MSALRALQGEFQDFVLAGRGTIFERVASGENLDPSRRMGIYYNAYRSRLIEALRTDYTALLALMGWVGFNQMAGAFVETTPSRERNLRWYGKSLPQFLRTTPPYAQQPWLAELAQFEWTISLCFDAADVVPMSFGEMAQIEAAAWPLLRFSLHPSHHRLALHTNAVGLRKTADAGEPLPAPESAADPTEWLLWRQDLAVMYRSLGPEEAWALDQVAAGATFTDLCEGLCAWVPAEEAAPRVAGMLRDWVEGQLITAVTTAPSEPL